MDPQLTELFSNARWAAAGALAVRVAVILLGAWVISVVARRVLQRLQRRLLVRTRREGDSAQESKKRSETLNRLLTQAVLVVVWVTALMMVLAQLGVSVAPLLASAGILGLAIGFGAQNLVRDVVSGFFVILENQVRVGDVAVVNGTGGVVESLNFRTIVLRDVSGTFHVFPNGAVTSLSNMTRDWSAYVFDVGIAYEADADRAMRVMQEVAAEMKIDSHYQTSIREDLEVFGIDQWGDSSVVIKARFKTEPGRQWEVGREYWRRLKRAFDDEGIEIPYPHRTIFFGEKSAPLRMRSLEGADGGSQQASASEHSSMNV